MLHPWKERSGYWPSSCHPFSSWFLSQHWELGWCTADAVVLQFRNKLTAKLRDCLGGTPHKKAVHSVLMWFAVAVTTTIFAVGNILFGHFEEKTPKWRRTAKVVLVLGFVAAL